MANAFHDDPASSTSVGATPEQVVGTAVGAGDLVDLSMGAAGGRLGVDPERDPIDDEVQSRNRERLRWECRTNRWRRHEAKELAKVTTSSGSVCAVQVLKPDQTLPPDAEDAEVMASAIGISS